MDSDEQKAHAAHLSEKDPLGVESGIESSVHNATTIEPETAKALLRRIDIRVMPVVRA